MNKDLQYAANCALWLLNQPELSDLLEGDWGDPAEIKKLLEDAGCVPSCESPPRRKRWFEKRGTKKTEKPALKKELIGTVELSKGIGIFRRHVLACVYREFFSRTNKTKRLYAEHGGQQLDYNPEYYDLTGKFIVK